MPIPSEKTKNELHRLFSPLTNISLQAEIITARGRAREIARAFQHAQERLYKELQEFPKEAVIGFRAPFYLLIACSYKNQGPMLDSFVNANLSYCGDEHVTEIGKRFVDKGANLLKRDPTGRLTIKEAIPFFKANLNTRNYDPGLEAVQDVYAECF